jgi:hypothetical protein
MDGAVGFPVESGFLVGGDDVEVALAELGSDRRSPRFVEQDLHAVDVMPRARRRRSAASSFKRMRSSASSG